MAKLKSGTRIYGTATIDTSVVVGSAVTLSSSGIQVAGIVTATSFSGSGANLTGIVSGVGIATAGGTVGTGATVLDFRGSGISTVTVASGIATINIAGGGGGSLTVVDNTTTNATWYVGVLSVTAGTASTIHTSSTKLNFNPSTGTLSATVFTSLSDQTQKTNVRKIENALETVMKIEGVKYEWKDNYNQPSIGVIAQEIEKVLPEVVTTNERGLKTVSYGNIVGLLIEAIKEQQVKIEDLERKINA